jgi:predicted amidohydrolase
MANWPAPRSLHWQSLLVARAIENQAYVAGCNRVGTDGNGHHYRGDSRIISPQGRLSPPPIRIRPPVLMPNCR